jgi:hypothetical protein
MTMTQTEAREQGLHGWTYAVCDNGLHLTPIGDLQDHMDEDCPCKPVRDPALGGAWSHNSFDGREAFENGERKPT